MRILPLGIGILALALSAATQVSAASKMLYVADPAMNMIYGHPLDGDTTNCLVPITGSVTIVAESVAHLSAREIAFVPHEEARVATLDLETRTLREVATSAAGTQMDVGPGTGPDDFVWFESNTRSRTNKLFLAARDAGTGQWHSDITELEIPAGAPVYGEAAVVALFAATRENIAILAKDGKLYLFRKGAPALHLLNTMAKSSIVRGPNGEILHFVPGTATKPVVFDAEGNPIDSAAVASAPLFASKPNTVEWRADAPQLAGVTQSLGQLLNEDTLDTTATVVIAHATRDENGSVIPERDITGAATLHRISPTRWQFYNEAGGLQVIDTTTHRAEYQLQFAAGSGPELSAINAMTVGPEGKLYVLDAGARLFRIDPGSGARELLKTLGGTRLQNFIHVRADGTIVLVDEWVDYIRLPSTHVVETWHLRLLAVRPQGAEWVVERGTSAVAPPSDLARDFRPIPDGVRALWRSDRLTRFTDLTMAGERTVMTPPLTVSGAPTVDGLSIFHELDHSGNSSLPVEAVTLRWNLNASGLGLNDYPTEVKIQAPSGNIVSIPRAELRVLDSEGRRTGMGNSEARVLTASVKLAAPEESSGVWRVESVLGAATPANMSSLAYVYKYPIAMERDPLFKASLLSMPQDDTTSLTLLGGFPPMLRQTDNAFASVRSVPLEGGDGLNRLGDVVTAPGGAVFTSEVEGFKVWRIDPATGSARAIIDRRPAALDPKLLGRNGSPNLRLAIGPTPEFFAAGGWVVN